MRPRRSLAAHTRPYEPNSKRPSWVDEGAGAGAPGAGGEGGQAGEAGQGQAGAAGSATGQTAQPGEIPYYTTPAELCAYVNQARQTSQGHDRFRGEPWGGEYHKSKTWPLAFSVDEGLNAAAQAEAEALVSGAAPKGKASTSGMISFHDRPAK